MRQTAGVPLSDLAKLAAKGGGGVGSGEPGPPGPAGAAGAAGVGVPGGGTIGQVLGKASAADHHTQWVDQSGDGGGGGGATDPGAALLYCHTGDPASNSGTALTELLVFTVPEHALPSPGSVLYAQAWGTIDSSTDAEELQVAFAGNTIAFPLVAAAAGVWQLDVSVARINDVLSGSDYIPALRFIATLHHSTGTGWASERGSNVSISASTGQYQGLLSVSGKGAASDAITQHQLIVHKRGTSQIGLPYATVSGGTETSDGTWKYYAFSTAGSDTLSVSSPGVVDVLLVGGGGGGGGYFSGGGGGGGAVLFRQAVYVSAAVTVTVGAGGTAGTATNGNGRGTDGGQSAFGALVRARGGGYGGGVIVVNGSTGPGGSGASGGGGGARNASAGGSGLDHYGGGTSRTGNTGGTGGGGGGGGALGIGQSVGGTDKGGNGGSALVLAEFTAFGASGSFGGGGGGGTTAGTTPGTGATGAGSGTAGGGNAGGAGTATSGGGGGGGGNTGTTGSAGGAGGSGLVVVRTRV
jgi:hypothetical protein